MQSVLTANLHYQTDGSDTVDFNIPAENFSDNLSDLSSPGHNRNEKYLTSLDSPNGIAQVIHLPCKGEPSYIQSPTVLAPERQPAEILKPEDEEYDALADLIPCSQCSEASETSLLAWMDHLSRNHPLPAKWPSSRIQAENNEKYPYTMVVGNQKKRRGNTIPRPLNSFMVFAQYIRRATLRWFPEAHNVRISQYIGYLWRGMSQTIRDQYAKEAVRLQRLHCIEFPEYKYKPRKRPRPESTSVQSSAQNTATQPTNRKARKQNQTTPNNEAKSTIVDSYPSRNRTTQDSPNVLAVKPNTSLPNIPICEQNRIMPTTPRQLSSDPLMNENRTPQNPSLTDLLESPSVFNVSAFRAFLIEPLQVLTQQTPIYSPNCSTFEAKYQVPLMNLSHPNLQPNSVAVNKDTFTPSISSFSPESVDYENRAVLSPHYVLHELTEGVVSEPENVHSMANVITNLETIDTAANIVDLNKLTTVYSSYPLNDTMIKLESTKEFRSESMPQCLDNTTPINSTDCADRKPCLPSIESWMLTTLKR